MKVSSMLYEMYLSQHNSKLEKSQSHKQAFINIADLESTARKELKAISNNALTIFDKFQEERTKYVCLLEEIAYSTGFATGFKLALETIED